MDAFSFGQLKKRGEGKETTNQPLFGIYIPIYHLSNILLIIVLDKKTFHHESWHFISVNRKIKYTIPTPHNFAKVDFTIKWNIVSLQIDF